MTRTDASCDAFSLTSVRPCQRTRRTEHEIVIMQGEATTVCNPLPGDTELDTEYTVTPQLGSNTVS